MKKFLSFQGVITRISDFIIDKNIENFGCYKLMAVENKNGDVVNFVVTPYTYFLDHIMMSVGDEVTGFYDGNAPAPAIYPPQYRAIVMARNKRYENVTVDFFDVHFISSDNMLRLNIAPFTPILSTNDQRFTNNPANHYLIVVYGPTTKSIPAQTTPYEIIVLCR